MCTMVGPLADDPLQLSREGHELEGRLNSQSSYSQPSYASNALLHVSTVSTRCEEVSKHNTVYSEMGFSEFHQMENLEENAKSYAERKVGKSRDASKKSRNCKERKA
jgi:hypothetical protein